MVLPAGFPDSVSRDYLPHQLWTFVKNCASASSYVLSTHCLLTAIGMQSEAAIPISAAANWVLKDGLGAFGVMLAASRFGKVLDSRVKAARWISEFGMVIGVGLEMLTPLVPAWMFLPLGSVANTFKVSSSFSSGRRRCFIFLLSKGLSAMTGGAAKATIHRHFACTGNLADVTAQSHSQHTAAYTIGTLIGVVLSMSSPSATSAAAWMLFGVLSSIQLYAVRAATRAVALSSLDASRGPALALQFLRGDSLSSPEEMRRIERFEWPFALGVSGLASSGVSLEVGASPTVFGTESAMRQAVAEADRMGRAFLVNWDEKRGTSVVLHSRARDLDIVQGMFEALRVAHGNGEGTKFEDFVAALKSAGWSLEGSSMETSSKQIRVEWESK